MKIERLNQPGVLLFTPDVYEDERGYFTETFNPHYGFKAVQANQSFSRQGVVRGLHFQKPATCKLVWVSSGRILDVAFNLKTGEHISQILDASGQKILIPKGYAHGLQALEDSMVHYLMDVPYSPNGDYGIDPLIIEWPLKPILSEKDANAPKHTL